MARPQKVRTLCCRPEFDYFQPKGIPENKLGTVELTPSEYEAIKHKYIDALDQSQIAKKLDISQPTFHRILNSANTKIAKALVEGFAIKIRN